MKLSAVILSGGSGTRLWPLSREYYPKQLLPLSGEESLLQATAARLDGLSNIEEPLIVCNEEHRFLVAEQFRALGKGWSDIILEPVGRNTAPALTLAALSLLEKNQDAIMLAMPADHIIRDKEVFHEAVRAGILLAEKGKLVTFGIVPTGPETGYGYIRKGEGDEVAEFVEKPDAATARKYVEAGDYFWNSGMFMMQPSVWIKEIAKYRPDILNVCEKAFKSGSRDQDFYRPHKESFLSCPGESIDYAVMEKTQNAAVVPLDAGWSDIGAWSSLWEISTQDEQGNAAQGDVLLEDTTNSFLLAQHRLLATVGLDNMIVVETSDAVLVADRSQSQKVKAIAKRLKEEGRAEYQFHQRVYRPWGDYEGVVSGERFQVKRITVKPGAALSLQMHHHRAEHWVVVKGTAKVTRGDNVIMLTENQSTYIPIGMKHRLENPGTIPLELIEVQSGSYLGEDDIVRFDDIYNRHNS